VQLAPFFSWRSTNCSRQHSPERATTTTAWMISSTSVWVVSARCVTRAVYTESNDEVTNGRTRVTAEVNETTPGSRGAIPNTCRASHRCTPKPARRPALAHPRAVTGGPVPNLYQLLSR